MSAPPSGVSPPSFREDDISKIPAIQLLVNLGYTYLTPEEALALRGGKTSEVLLEEVLAERLRVMNTISFKGKVLPFSESAIQGAIQALKDISYDGLLRTNAKLYDLITLGKSLPQMVEGDLKSFPLRYVDFETPGANAFHVTEEFAVDRTGSGETRRPDLVLFVNGIPLAVIECKRPDLKEPMEQAVSQQIRNQRDEEIPRLFRYSQLLAGVAKNEAKVATVGSPAKFWAVWREPKEIEPELKRLVNRPLEGAVKEKLFASRARCVRAHFEALEAEGREITQQDRALFCLFRPERLLRLTYRYTLFDAGEKKIARYQQFFCVENTLERIRQFGPDGARLGGVVWHTQGSGKSLTMVMLAQAIALEPGLRDFKIVLVTDRVDLDDQIYKTFQHCGAEAVQAKTGRHLGELLAGRRARIITTIIDKFEAALGKGAERNESHDIFVLVDEGHRGQYGPLHAKMRKVLPRACFIAFTGTPVVKKEKNTIQRFGGLIQPTYTIGQAVEDKAVVPLLYEGRHVEQSVDRRAVDTWFARVTQPLTASQAADLKKKFATGDHLNEAEKKIQQVAWDVGSHFRDHVGLPFKAQLVAPSKAAALRYKGFLDDFGLVTSEVVISGPDEREGFEEIDGPSTDAVVVFWQKMMAKYGSEKEYNRQVINAFLHGDAPEILIVVDKLLTGFDAPRNTVLYLTRPLKDHTLLQAIARVNRLYEGKEYGVVLDYWGVLSDLNDALNLYGRLAQFDSGDLEGTLTDVGEVVAQLPQHHAGLWDVFKEIGRRSDEEAYELLLADEALRNSFYEKLSLFARTFALALSTVKFIRDNPEEKIEGYRKDLAFFMNLRASVRRRYAETVDFKEYEGKIQRLIDTHVGTGEVRQLTGLVNIFEKEAFAEEVEKLTGSTSKADTIAFRTKRTLEVRMEEDPAFYKKFSQMLEETILAFRERRMSDLDYLCRVESIRESVRDRKGDDLPQALQGRGVASAYFGSLCETFQRQMAGRADLTDAMAQAALEIEQIIEARRIVRWTQNPDVQNDMRNAIEDSLLDLKARLGLDLGFEDLDRLMEQCMDIAKVRRP